MSLRELVLYGKDQRFGKWFHQQCIYIRSRSDTAADRFRNEGLAQEIDDRIAQRLNEFIGNYTNALFIVYLVLAISEDQGEDYLVKRLTPIAAVTNTVFGSRTLELYEQAIDYIASRKVTPESAITHLLVDSLEVPLSHEGAALESAFSFFEHSLKEDWIPKLAASYSHNVAALNRLLETLGHNGLGNDALR